MAARSGMPGGLLLALGLALALCSAEAGRLLLESCPTNNFPALQPTRTNNAVLDLQWLDKDDKYVFAITKKAGVDAGGLWWSQDGAKTWVSKTQMLNDTIPSSEPIDIIGVYTQRSNAANVAILGTGTYIWVSNDFGNTFRAIKNSGWKGSGIRSSKLHPRQDGWLMVLVKRPSCKSLDHAQMECPHDLMLTQDLFATATWRNLTADAGGKIAGFVDFDWGSSLCTQQQISTGACPRSAMVPDETVFATMYEKPGDYDQPWDPDVHFVVSTNWFSDYSMHVRCGNMFELVGHTVYLAFANACPTDIAGNKRSFDRSEFLRGITLYTSIDGTNSFQQACLPVALNQEGYELMETHDGSGAVIVVDFLLDNGYMQIPMSSVYTAGPHHALFSLSLTSVYHADFGFSSDFSKVEGLPGIYIANQLAARPTASGAPALPSSDYDDMTDSTGPPLVQTVMTFNGGSSWGRIPAPQSFNFAGCNRCDSRADCWLHLHGMSSWDSLAASLPAVYSNPSAPGFIMATGNVGSLGVGLDDNDGLCTWLSTDGGVTWSDVGEGAFIYEYADWGGVIVMARHPGIKGQPADEVMFSLDYGKCWQTVPLAEALIVDNIRIEPDGQRPRVVVHGRACRKTSGNEKCMYAADDTRSLAEGLLYLVDVQELLASKVNQCTYADYEKFDVPTDVHNGAPRCILGQQMAITRRKPTSGNCLNGPEWKRPDPVTSACNCTSLDLECDYGYLRNGALCNPIHASNMPHCPVLDDGTYSVSATGQRLVHGDICTNVNGIIPDTDGQGTRTDGGGGGGSSGGKKGRKAFGFFMFLLVAGVLGGGAFAWWRFAATEAAKDTVRDAVSGAVGFAQSLWALVMEKIRGPRHVGLQEEQLGYFQPLGDAGAHEQPGGIFTLK